METFLFIAHIILSFVIIISILLQSGDGGGMGAGFGGAAAVGQEIFGGRGAATFLGKFTVFLGASFMITSMALAWYSSKPQSVLDLGQGSGMSSQAQVHQIIEEGTGPMPGQGSSGEAGGMEIPPEIMEQLQQQMQGDSEELEMQEEAEPAEEPASEVEAPASEQEENVDGE